MEKHITLIGNVENSQWMQKIKTPLALLGNIKTLEEEDVTNKNGRLYTDLIIIDSSGMPNIIEFVEFIKENNKNTSLLVVTASPTWRRTREIFKAGADDYLKQTDVKKIVSICQNMLYRETVLLADNHIEYLDEMADYFKDKGHFFLQANNPDEAQNLLLQHNPAVAIVDIKLKDDRDSKDKSGLDLVLKLYERLNTKFIVLTRENFPIQEILPVLLPDERNRRPAVNFVLKNDGFEPLYEAVELLLNIDFKYLAHKIGAHFSQDELRRFCFYELDNLEYDQLEGNTLADKVMSLIQYHARRGQTRELVKTLCKKRPNVDFIGARSE